MSLRTQERESDGGACLFLLAIAALFAVTHYRSESPSPPEPTKTASRPSIRMD